jgi:hypothetical protein
MALQAKVGSFDTGTDVVSSSVIVTGVGFQGKVAIFWWSGRTGSSDAVGSAHALRGIGFAISSSSRRAVTTRSEDAATSSDTAKGHYDSACVVVFSGTANAVDGLLDFASFDADGFTLTVDDQFSASFRIHYLVLGGSDLTDYALGTFITAAGTGDEAYTGVGFEPDCLLFLSANTGTPNAPVGGGEMVFGAATEASQWVYYCEDVSASATMATVTYCRADECYANAASGSTTIRASL